MNSYPEHPAGPAGSSEEAQRRHAAYVANVGQHGEAARREVEKLVQRTRVLIRNGIDLRDPDRFIDYAEDQIRDAIEAAVIPTCACEGSEGAAALALIGELARQLAEATR